jgi:hypothetical protein
LGEFRIAVVDQVALPQEESINGVSSLPAALLHKGSRRVRRDARDVDTPRGEFHNHEHALGHQAVPGRDLDREKVRGRKDVPVQFQEL